MIRPTDEDLFAADLWADLFTMTRTKPRPRARDRVFELVRELLSPAELVVTIATLALALLLLAIAAATVYLKFHAIELL